MAEDETRKRRAEYAERLRAQQLREGFSYTDDEQFVTRPYWPLEPKNRIQPHLWKWSQVRQLTLEAGEMIGLGRDSESYDRRVLALTNPGVTDEFTLSGTLFGDIQLIKAGESAPCHRHTPCATRFILEGQNGWTSVAGERVQVHPGDIVFTGQNPWHDHGNAGPDDFLFFDVLDIPLLYFTGTSAWEFDYESVTGSRDRVNQPPQVVDFPAQRYANAELRPRFSPTWSRQPDDFAHLNWLRTRTLLLELHEERGCPYDALRMEFTRANGEAIGPTMSIFTQMLRARQATRRHRHTSASVYVGVDGQGIARIEDREFLVEPGDIFVIPSWHWHSFENRGGQPWFLHSISDLSLIQKLRLYREQREVDGEIHDSGWGAK